MHTKFGMRVNLGGGGAGGKEAAAWREVDAHVGAEHGVTHGQQCFLQSILIVCPLHMTRHVILPPNLYTSLYPYVPSTDSDHQHICLECSYTD